MSNRKTVAVTGADGFIGTALSKHLEQRGFCVKRIVRSAKLQTGVIEVGDINASTDWLEALNGVHYVVHCAGRAHFFQENNNDAISKFRKVNVDGTLQLAKHAFECGVRRIIFLSSLGVLGDSFHSGDTEECGKFKAPTWDYAKSKLEAENKLKEFARSCTLEFTIVRPPLVYGPGVPGNFRRLLKLIDSGFPLPFAAFTSPRSMIALENLNTFLEECITNKRAEGETFFVSDGRDLSLADISTLISKVYYKRPRIFFVPLPLIKFASKLFGRERDFERLANSLSVDIKPTLDLLNWKPHLSVEEGIQQTVEWYMRKQF